jgi:hypothetical protein
MTPRAGFQACFARKDVMDLQRYEPHILVWSSVLVSPAGTRARSNSGSVRR